MLPEKQAVSLFEKYGLADVPRISDPEREFYVACGLVRGGVLQVMGPAVWWQGFKTTVLKRHLPRTPAGDVFQLQGAVVLQEGAIVRSFIAKNSAEIPDYLQLISDLPAE